MEDTQRSQPISTENQGIAEWAACTSSQDAGGPESGEGLPLLVAESSLERIRGLAMRQPDLVFTSVAHRSLSQNWQPYRRFVRQETI